MFRDLLFQVVKRRWFIVALLLGFGTICLPRPDGLTPEGQKTLGILVFSLICFLSEPVPLPAVALLIGVGEVIFGIKGPKEMPQSYMSSAVFFIMGSLMIGAALVQLRLDRRIALLLVKFTGPRFIMIISGLSLTAALLATLVGPHVITAVFMPVALVLVNNCGAEENDKRRMVRAMLLALAYAAAIGGLGTPSGSARNAILIHYFDTLYGVEVFYLDWILVALPMVLLSVPAVVLVCFFTFRPQQAKLSRSIIELRHQSAKDRNPGKAMMALLILAVTFTLFLTVSRTLGIGTIAVGGASLFMVTGLVRWKQIDQGVNWGVVLLYMAAISLGLSMDETGAAKWLAETLTNNVLPAWFHSGLPFLFAVTVIVMLGTNVLSGGPAVAVLTPILLAMTASGQENDPGTTILTGFVIAAASSLSFLTIMGNPANSIVFASGTVSPPHFLKAGWKMTIITILLIMAMATFYWPYIISMITITGGGE